MNLEPNIFVGDASDAEARVYASVARTGIPDNARLEGELVGPFCRYSQTLPARIPFIDRGPGTTILAEAIVPDPCFWTRELPFMYQATLRLKGSIQTPPTAQDQTITKNRPFAIRRLGVRGSSIFLDQKRFVLRAVRRFSAAIADLKSARHVASALYVDEPSDDFLREASEEGVLLAVHCSQACSPGDPAGELRGLTSELARLSRWPAVAVVVLNPNVPDERTLRVAAPNVLFAQQLFPNSTDPPRAWAHLAWCELGLTGLTRPQYELPLIAHRVMPGAQTIDQLRRACDQLQANLAPLGDFAGYVVSMADVANNQA